MINVGGTERSARAESIADPVRIERILGVATESRRAVVYRDSDGGFAQGTLSDLVRRGDRWTALGVGLSSPLSCTVDLPAGIASFTLATTSRVPRVLVRQRVRGHARVACEKPIYLWIGDERHEAETINVSSAGLACLTVRSFEVGEQLRIETEMTTPLDAVVRHVSPATATVGLELDRESSTQANWDAFVRGARGWKTEENAASASDVYALFERAGYVQTGPSGLAIPRDHFVSAFEKRKRVPDIAVQHSWPDREGLVYSVSGVRLYSRAWFGFHLAKRPGGSPAASKRELLRSAITEHHESLLGRPSGDFVCTYIRDDARWSKLAFHEFAARYVPVELAAQHAVVPWSFSVARPVDVSAEAATESAGLGKRGEQAVVAEATVEPATAEERDEVAAWFAERHSKVFRDALDLGRDALSMRDISEAWVSRGMDRARAVLSARRGEQRAFAVAERVEPGVHFFEVLNSVRLIGDPELWPALLEHARTQFYRAPLSRFVALVEPNAMHDLEKRGGSSLGKAVLNIYARDVIADLIEHVWELCGVSAAVENAAVENVAVENAAC